VHIQHSSQNVCISPSKKEFAWHFRLTFCLESKSWLFIFKFKAFWCKICQGDACSKLGSYSTGGHFFLTIKIILGEKFLTSCHLSFLVKGNHLCWLNALSGRLLRETRAWRSFWWHCSETPSHALSLASHMMTRAFYLKGHSFIACLTAVATRKPKCNKQTKYTLEMVAWKATPLAKTDEVLSSKEGTGTFHSDFLGVCY